MILRRIKFKEIRNSLLLRSCLSFNSAKIMKLKTSFFKSNGYQAPLLLLMLGFIWGSGYSLARIATTHGVDPLGYAFWQSLGPAILLGGILLIRRLSNVRHDQFVQVNRLGRSLRFYVICGLFGIAIPNSVMYFVAPHLPASLVAVLVNLVPIVTYLIALGMRLERFHWLRFLSVVLSITGIMVLIAPSFHIDFQEASWVLLTLLAPLCFAFVSIFIERGDSPNNNLLILSFGMLSFSAVILCPLVLVSHQFYKLQWLDLPTFVILLEIILSSVGYVLLFYIVKHFGAVYYSMTNGIVALTGLFWGSILFDQHLSYAEYMATLLIISSLVLINLVKRVKNCPEIT